MGRVRNIAPEQKRKTSLHAEGNNRLAPARMMLTAARTSSENETWLSLANYVLIILQLNQYEQF